MKGSSVYLTPAEKETIEIAIEQYICDIDGADSDSEYKKYFIEHDEKSCADILKKLRR